MTDIQYAHFLSSDQDSSNISSAKAQAADLLVGAKGAGNWVFLFINQSQGGARLSTLTAQANPTETNVTKALSETKIALEKVKYALDVVPLNSVLSDLEKANLMTEKSSMNTEILIDFKQNKFYQYAEKC